MAGREVDSSCLVRRWENTRLSPSPIHWSGCMVKRRARSGLPGSLEILPICIRSMVTDSDRGKFENHDGIEGNQYSVLKAYTEQEGQQTGTLNCDST